MSRGERREEKMEKNEAKKAMLRLSSGTLANLTDTRTYAEGEAVLLEILELIDSTDVSGCEDWVDVWYAIHYPASCK
jgi:hypothetical protein